MINHMFNVGQKVRSFDFPGIRDDCYVDGVISKLYMGYATIEVERDVCENKDTSNPRPVITAWVEKHDGIFNGYGVIAL